MSKNSIAIGGYSYTKNICFNILYIIYIGEHVFEIWNSILVSTKFAYTIGDAKTKKNWTLENMNTKEKLESWSQA